MADILETSVVTSDAAVTVVLGNETAVISSEKLSPPLRSGRAAIFGFVTFIPGAGTTSVNLRIRRGTLITDPVVQSVVGVNQPVAAGSSANYEIVVSESYADISDVQYTLTLLAGLATANGSISHASILVLLL